MWLLRFSNDGSGVFLERHLLRLTRSVPRKRVKSSLLPILKVHLRDLSFLLYTNLVSGLVELTLSCAFLLETSRL